MSTPTNHWKLGLFVVGGALLALAVVVYLGASKLSREHVDYVTYFDESVQGLDIGSPVKFRGVTVGRVSRIDVAPDRRHVAVTSALHTEDLAGFRLSEGEGDRTRILVPSDLRAQLVNQGITGLKFVQLDFFEERLYPRPVLTFETPEKYIPAALSTLENVEQAVISATGSLPEMMQSMTRVTDRAARMMEQLEGQKLPERLASTLLHLDQLLTGLNAAVEGIDARGLGAKLNATIAHANSVLSRLDGDRGLFASAQRATDAFGDFAALSPDIGSDLTDTLRDIREAASSIRRVADALERDPDMLIKGRKVAR